MRVEEQIEKYLNVFIERRWKRISDMGDQWLVDIKSSFWIAEIRRNDSIYINWNIVYDIGQLYDISTLVVKLVVEAKLEEIFNRKINHQTCHLVESASIGGRTSEERARTAIRYGKIL